MWLFSRPPSPEYLLGQILEMVRELSPEQNAALVRVMLDAERRINRKLEMIMHTLEDTLALVEDQKTRIDSLVVLVTDLHQRVIDAIGAGGLTPSQQMRVDAIFDAVKNSADEVDAAITANTVSATAGAVSDGPSAADIKAGLGKQAGNSQSGSGLDASAGSQNPTAGAGNQAGSSASSASN